MKDIVEACEISRGGLYLYFSSTEEIFLEVLQMEQEETDDVFEKSISENAMASDILALFLKEQKKELLRRMTDLIVEIEGKGDPEFRRSVWVRIDEHEPEQWSLGGIQPTAETIAAKFSSPKAS